MNSYFVIILVGMVFGGMFFLHRQLSAIHELVNSNLTKVQTELSLAQRRIETLEAHIARPSSE